MERSDSRCAPGEDKSRGFESSWGPTTIRGFSRRLVGLRRRRLPRASVPLCECGGLLVEAERGVRLKRVLQPELPCVFADRREHFLAQAANPN